jgi:hypothetical protein
MKRLAIVLVLLFAGVACAHTVWLGKITDGRYTLTPTDAHFAIIDGDNSRLHCQWSTEERCWLIHLDPNEKHRTTDGQIPTMYIQPSCSNVVRIVPRFTN